MAISSRPHAYQARILCILRCNVGPWGKWDWQPWSKEVFAKGRTNAVMTDKELCFAETGKPTCIQVRATSTPDMMPAWVWEREMQSLWNVLFSINGCQWTDDEWLTTLLYYTTDPSWLSSDATHALSLNQIPRNPTLTEFIECAVKTSSPLREYFVEKNAYWGTITNSTKNIFILELNIATLVTKHTFKWARTTRDHSYVLGTR